VYLYSKKSACFRLAAILCRKYRVPSEPRSQAASGAVSTGVGDHFGTPRAAGFFCFFCVFLFCFLLFSFLLLCFCAFFLSRPYQIEPYLFLFCACCFFLLCFCDFFLLCFCDLFLLCFFLLCFFSFVLFFFQGPIK
jgi:hypothetical protein